MKESIYSNPLCIYDKCSLTITMFVHSSEFNPSFYNWAERTYKHNSLSGIQFNQKDLFWLATDNSSQFIYLF